MTGGAWRAAPSATQKPPRCGKGNTMTTTTTTARPLAAQDAAAPVSA